MISGIDLKRSSAIFNPHNLKCPVNVIGCGATGSRILKALVTYGVPGCMINAYDFDTIAEHNIGNQLQRKENVGRLKVKCLKEDIEHEYGETINVFAEAVTGKTKLKGIVFLLVDKFVPRHDIMTGLEMNPNISLIIETGVGSYHGVSRTINPMKMSHLKYLKSKWSKIDTDERDESGAIIYSACGSAQVISSTIDMLAAIATVQFIDVVMENTEIGSEVYFANKPFFFREIKID